MRDAGTRHETAGSADAEATAATTEPRWVRWLLIGISLALPGAVPGGAVAGRVRPSAERRLVGVLRSLGEPTPCRPSA